MMVSSINLPIITHECNYSKKKSIHFFSFEHQCQKTQCTLSEEKSTEDRFSKVPCCEIETLMVESQEFTAIERNVSIVQSFILSSLYSFILPQKTIEKSPIKLLEPELKHFGYQYRIELQSFLC